MKINFANDYAQGCHPDILTELIHTNHSIQNGYGMDDFSLKAHELIKKEFQCPNAQVTLVSGGTQANLIVISSILRPHQSVIATEDGHIATNETGAIEATGHKVNTIATPDGKLTPELCGQVLAEWTNVPHVVKPKMVYISNTTEVGTHYTLDELEALHAFTRKHNMYLFMDGARLAQALAIDRADVTAADIARLCDVFYLGATKNGGLLGEAIVITNKDLQEDFLFHVKQKGAMLAKGRILGIQFTALLNNGLYLQLAENANKQAMKLKTAFNDMEVSFLTDTYANQIFPILSNQQIQALQKEFEFRVWKQIDGNHAAIRLITAWNTSDNSVNKLIAMIKSMTSY